MKIAREWSFDSRQTEPSKYSWNSPQNSLLLLNSHIISRILKNIPHVIPTFEYNDFNSHELILSVNLETPFFRKFVLHVIV